LAAIAAFVAIHFLIDEGGFRAQLGQAWASHFASARSFEYGSPLDRPFDWALLLRNWDVTLPALVGIVGLLSHARRHRWTFVLLAWCFGMLAVFGLHRPWWSYYYVHNSIPLCWCAALGWVAVGRHLGQRQGWGTKALVGVCALAPLLWTGARVGLEVEGLRSAPRLHRELVLREMERYRPWTEFLYAEEPICSFHAGLPMPPRLAVAGLKRFWSGDLTNARLVEELARIRPGLVLLTQDTRERPFDAWLRAEYRLVYEDAKHRLYALRSVIDQAER
jgi:hypothetical protein